MKKYPCRRIELKDENSRIIARNGQTLLVRVQDGPRRSDFHFIAENKRTYNYILTRDQEKALFFYNSNVPSSEAIPFF